MTTQPTFLTINGVDWTQHCAEIAPVTKEIKKTVNNLKGDVILLSGRITKLSNALNLAFPFMLAMDMLKLKALATDGNKVDVQHNLDLPTGKMSILEFNRQVVKSMDGILYNVTMLVVYDPDIPDSSGISPVNPATYTSQTITEWVG